MKAAALIVRIERFKKDWIANPAAQLEFARIIEASHDSPSFDHADEPLREWIDEEKQTAKRLGIS